MVRLIFETKCLCNEPRVFLFCLVFCINSNVCNLLVRFRAFFVERMKQLAYFCFRFRIFFCNVGRKVFPGTVFVLFRLFKYSSCGNIFFYIDKYEFTKLP